MFFQPEIKGTPVLEQREGLNTLKRWLVNLVPFRTRKCRI